MAFSKPITKDAANEIVSEHLLQLKGKEDFEKKSDIIPINQFLNNYKRILEAYKVFPISPNIANQIVTLLDKVSVLQLKITKLELDEKWFVRFNNSLDLENGKISMAEMLQKLIVAHDHLNSIVQSINAIEFTNDLQEILEINFEINKMMSLFLVRDYDGYPKF